MRPVIVVLQQNQLVSFSDVCVISDLDRPHEPRHLGAQRRQIAPDVSVVRGLLDSLPLPRIPVARKGDDDRERQQENQYGRAKPLP